MGTTGARARACEGQTDFSTARSSMIVCGFPMLIGVRPDAVASIATQLPAPGKVWPAVGSVESWLVEMNMQARLDSIRQAPEPEPDEPELEPALAAAASAGRLRCASA